jgi:hypothetical protein
VRAAGGVRMDGATGGRGASYALPCQGATPRARRSARPSTSSLLTPWLNKICTHCLSSSVSCVAHTCGAPATASPPPPPVPPTPSAAQVALMETLAPAVLLHPAGRASSPTKSPTKDALPRWGGATLATAGGSAPAVVVLEDRGLGRSAPAYFACASLWPPGSRTRVCCSLPTRR